MILLVFDTAGSEACVALVDASTVRARRDGSLARGLPGRLPVWVVDILAECPLGERAIGAIACVAGPGSFTGCRGALALAHGLALGWQCPVVAVTVGEAVRAARFPASSGAADGVPVWVATASGRSDGRLFLDRGDGNIGVIAPDAVPLPSPGASPPLLAGDAATLLGARFAANGIPARYAPSLVPTIDGIVAAAVARLDGRLSPRPPLPVYVEPPGIGAPRATAGTPADG